MKLLHLCAGLCWVAVFTALPISVVSSADPAPSTQNTAVPIPILYSQTTSAAGSEGYAVNGTAAIFPSYPPRRVAVGKALGRVFWDGNHRRMLSLNFRATVRDYDIGRGRFGPPADAATALASPGVHYVLPLNEIAQTNAVDWSRDGGTLCYYKQKTGFVFFDLRRGTAQLLKSSFFARHDVSALTISPDGREIAFSVAGQDEFHAEFFQDLWLIGRNGQHLRKLGHGMFPSWSPQGRMLLATEGSDQDGRAILRYDTQTGMQRVLIKVQEPAEADGTFGQARYSPDGLQIAVFGPPDPHKSEKEALFLMSARGRFLRTLATEKSLGEAGIPSFTW